MFFFYVYNQSLLITLASPVVMLFNKLLLLNQILFNIKIHKKLQFGIWILHNVLFSW